MTNTPNEFAQQLDSLFNELHTVLQKNLVDKVNKDDFERVITEIKGKNDIVIRNQQEMSNKIQNLETKLKQLQQQMLQAQPIPTPRPQDKPQNQSSATASNGSDRTDQFGNKLGESIQIQGAMIAGRKNLQTQSKFFRPPFNPITTNELIHCITSSKYYNESIHKSTEILALNTANLMTETNGLELALQLCILIDLQNMHLMGYTNKEDLYKSHSGIIRAKIINGIAQEFCNILEGYGLLRDQLNYNLDTLKAAITNLACLNEEDTTARIKDSYLYTSQTKREENFFPLFQSKMKQVINNNQPKTGATTGTDTE